MTDTKRWPLPDACEAVEDWVVISWAECANCGGEVAGPGDADERLFDGEPLVCTDCGAIHQMNADEDGWQVLSSGEHVTEAEVARLNAALRGVSA